MRDREGGDGGRTHPLGCSHRASLPERADPGLAGEGRAAQHPRQVRQVPPPLRDRFALLTNSIFVKTSKFPIGFEAFQSM